MYSKSSSLFIDFNPWENKLNVSAGFRCWKPFKIFRDFGCNLLLNNGLHSQKSLDSNSQSGGDSPTPSHKTHSKNKFKKQFVEKNNINILLPDVVSSLFIQLWSFGKVKGYSSFLLGKSVPPFKLTAISLGFPMALSC